MKRPIGTGRGAFLTGLALLMILLVAGQALAGPLAAAVDWWVIAAGGGPATGGNAIMESTFGQPMAGRSSSGDIALSAGYQQPRAEEYRQFLPAACYNAGP